MNIGYYLPSGTAIRNGKYSEKGNHCSVPCKGLRAKLLKPLGRTKIQYPETEFDCLIPCDAMP
jgi:hypothetical protein